ncbi:siderophore-interacting protein [Saccharopolyspora erythraea]|uniref:siderophore-interacting protein n=1 Tax=Saccharopolyspora erythraea TaxID=1836 RepID=UPI001BA4C3BC|nr:siderophore-interacting protein [Saccharopolyspora erythraea]QUH02970.1 siderophore-interacting protein [Saccharopolyspora erythraea]
MTIQTPPRPRTSTAFRLFPVEVTGVRRLGANLARITFGGAELGAMASGGLDQRIKLVFPLPGQDLVLPEGDQPFQALCALPDGIRPHLRTYTLRAHRPEQREFDVDFVLHGDTGPGSAFGMRARVGDRIAAYAPNAEHPHGRRFAGVEYDFERLGERTLLVGDETALPAIASILEALPPGVRAEVFAEVPDSGDVLSIPTAAEVRVHWLPRLGCEAPGVLVADALRASRPATGAYCWIAGERDMVTSTRRYLLGECGFDRESITFMGYWRRGVHGDLPAN